MRMGRILSIFLLYFSLKAVTRDSKYEVIWLFKWGYYAEAELAEISKTTGLPLRDVQHDCNGFWQVELEQREHVDDVILMHESG